VSLAADPLIRFCSDVLARRVSATTWSELSGELDALVETADHEGVTGLLAAALAGMSGELPKSLGQALQVQAMHELARLAKARYALDALAETGIPVLVLKGSALAYWLYDSPLHRPRCDLDLLVPDIAAARRAVSVLEASGFRLVAGLAPDRSPGSEVALVHSGTLGQAYAVDLHWRLSNSALLAKGFEFRELWAQSVAIPALHKHAHGLGRVHALAHALLHRISNVPLGKQDRLIWLYDIHLLAGGCSGQEWQAFLRLCRDKGIAVPCMDGLRACKRAFGTAVPADVFAAKHVGAGDEGWPLDERFDQAAMDRATLASLPWRDRIRWLRHKLFPPVEFMRHRYGANGFFGLAKAYLGRCWTGVKSGIGG
jgi:hypothetical protein